jgi:hypothetical protein
MEVKKVKLTAKKTRKQFTCFVHETHTPINTTTDYQNVPGTSWRATLAVAAETGFISEGCAEIILKKHCTCDEWVPVTTEWRVLRLRMEERPPIWKVAANILNKQSRTANKGWSSSLGVVRGANNSSP